MNWLKKILKLKQEFAVLAEREIKGSENIPEPTHSLIFIADENPSKAVSPMTITITVNLTNDGIRTTTEDHHNFFGEPSLICKKLPVHRNDELEKNPIYYPSYISLTPNQRFQYISWLKDVTKPTNLSYVFLYYYGLERHLLIGKYEEAVEEIFRLLQHHDKGSFRSYAQDALIATAIYRNQLDIFSKHHMLFHGLSNEILLMRRHIGLRITAEEIVALASVVGFKNKRYIKLYSADFKNELKQLLDNFEQKYDSILETIPSEDLKSEEVAVFANFSIPEKFRITAVPQLLRNEIFQALLRNMLTAAHNNLKEKRSRRN